MPEEDSRRSSPRRRDVLKGTATLGLLSATGQVVGAAPSNTSVNVGQALGNRTVQALLAEIPGVRLKRNQATVYGDESLLAVPANYGTLITTVPDFARGSRSGEGRGDVSATFYFDRWVSGVDGGWTRGTAAQLSASGETTVLQRTATKEEKLRFLSELNLSHFNPKETRVTVTPDHGSVRIMHRRTDRRVIEWVTAREQSEGEIRRQDEDAQIQRTDSGVYGGGVSTEGVDCEKDLEGFASNILYCIWDYSDCAFCAVASVAPPVSVACWIVVCLDAGVSVAAELLADIGCAAAAQDACLDAIVKEYADSIVTVPTPV